MRVAPIFYTAVCITNLGGLMKSAAHYYPGDVIHRYHGTNLFVAICHTIKVLLCAAASVLHTRYVLRVQISLRNTTTAAEIFFAAVCITIRK